MNIWIIIIWTAEVYESIQLCAYLLAVFWVFKIPLTPFKCWRITSATVKGTVGGCYLNNGFSKLNLTLYKCDRDMRYSLKEIRFRTKKNFSNSFKITWLNHFWVRFKSEHHCDSLLNQKNINRFLSIGAKFCSIQTMSGHALR